MAKTKKTQKVYEATSTNAMDALAVNNTPGKRKINTWDWVKFGNSLTARQALMELFTNALGAILRAIAVLGMSNTVRRIAVDVIKYTDGFHYLVVKNSGAPADLNAVMNYGNSQQKTVVNQNGVGTKSAFSLFNRSNSHFWFYTKWNGVAAYIKAPYSEDMEILACDGSTPEATWTFEEWVVSAAIVRIDNPMLVPQLTEAILRKEASVAIRDLQLTVTFNGQDVFAEFPKGHCTKEDHLVDIVGEKVTIGYELYERKEDEGTVLYPNSMSVEGVHLFVNGVFATYEGVGLFKKSDSPDGKLYLKPHQSMNKYVVIVKITTPDNHKADLPFDNHKTVIKYDDSEVGCAYRAAIDKLVGTPFRKAYHEAQEKAMRAKFDEIMQKASKGLYVYQREFCCTPNGGKDSEYADAALGHKYLLNKNGTIKRKRAKKGQIGEALLDPTSLTTLVEFKKVPFTAKMVCGAMSYYMDCEENYGIKPNMLFVAEAFTPNALKRIEQYRAEGVEIELILLNEEA